MFHLAQAWDYTRFLGDGTGKNTFLIGGGTDIMPLIRHGLVTPHRLISLASIKELSEITWREEEIFIGSTATLTQLAEERRLYQSISVLA